MSLAAAAQSFTFFPRRASNVKTPRESRVGPKWNQVDHATLLFPDALPDFGDRLTPLLDSLISEYVQSIAREQLCEIDVLTFVDWLAGNKTVEKEEKEFFISNFSQPGVAFISVEKRLIHARFEELTSAPVQYRQRLLESRTQIYLNPNHVWATTAKKDVRRRQHQVAEEILFYQVRGEVLMTTIEPPLIPMIKTLTKEPVLARTFLQQLDSSGHPNWCDALLRLLEKKVLAVT